MRWGITLPVQGLPLLDHRALVEELAGLGYTDIWSSEVNDADAFTPLVLFSQWTSLRLGTAIAPVFTRGPATLAMTAAAVAEAAPGRFMLGIGASSPVIVENWNAGRFAQPYEKTKATLAFLKRALAGEKINGFRLERRPAQPPAIALAALRPGMLGLAAREADAAISNWISANDVRRVREALGPDTELLARLFVIPTEDENTARFIGRRLISSYLTVPVYAAFHEWLGRADVLAPMWEAWESGDRKKANEVIPDEVVDDLVLHGSPERCKERIGRYVENGLDTPILMVVAGPGDAPEMIRALAA